MVTLKIQGNPTSTNLSSICANTYKCTPADMDISPDLKANPYVVIKHNRAIDGDILVTIAGDNMSAAATFLPAINGGNMPSYDEMMRIALTGGTHPLDKELIDEDAFRAAYDLATANTLIFSVVIAVGRKPMSGTDAKVTLFFDIPSDKPSEDASGKTNYKKLNKYVNIRAEQLLARVTPATPGTPGRSVTGQSIPQSPGKEIDLSAGEGVRVNDAKTDFFSTTDGYVTYNKKIISVTPVINIKNVDLATGNIDFVGDILISGDVQPGFTVKGKNITISGICQDATITADENITISMGAKGGSSENSLTAGGDITLGYCEHYTVNARASININKYAFNSKLNAGDKIVANAKSTIAGGRIVAFAGCVFFNLGTKANTDIEVIVGRKFDAEDKLGRINAEKIRLEQSIEKIDEALGKLDLNNQKIKENQKVKKMVETKELITKRIELFNRRINSISSESVYENPIIEIQGEVQDGAVFKFHGTDYVVRDNKSKVKFYLDKAAGAVKYMPA